ncbi:MAG: hypothetical protein R3B95_06110 [Nitrospirales bacterium]|nr:hypothetical protein [Nitrospirales bacterium]
MMCLSALLLGGVIYGNRITIQTMVPLVRIVFAIPMGTAYRGSGFPPMEQVRIQWKPIQLVLRWLRQNREMIGRGIRLPRD